MLTREELIRILARRDEAITCARIGHARAADAMAASAADVPALVAALLTASCTARRLAARLEETRTELPRITP